MTGEAITCGAIVSANALAVATVAMGEISPILEFLQNGTSVAAVMGLFLWREMKRAERYEHLYDEERKHRQEAENKCASCVFVEKAHAEFLKDKKE